MIENYLCEACDKNAVCKIMDILSKFDIETKKAFRCRHKN